MAVREAFVLSPELATLRERSLPRFFALLAFDWTVIVGAFWAAAAFDHPLMYVAAWFIVGTRQHALGVLGHEGTHGLIHKNRRLNDWIARVFCFWPIFMPYEGYSPWHVAHHKYLGSDRDTENAVKAGPRFALPTRFASLVFTFISDLCGFGLRSMLFHVHEVRPQGRHSLARAYGGAALGWALASALFVALDLWWIPALWFVALGTSFWAVFRVREYFEHTGTSATYRYHLGPIGRFCFCPNYIWVHYEHHKWPFIPCFRLLEARKLDDSVPVLSMWQLIRHLEDPDFERIKLPPRTADAGSEPSRQAPQAA